MLYGRAAEQSVIDELLAGACAGHSGVLVIRGDPGIGKTALLDYAARSANVARGPGGVGMRVVRGCGVESEAELPFAGLHLLLGPTLDRLPALPQPTTGCAGMFVHMGIGKPGQWSAGNMLTSVGAVLLAGALLTTGRGDRKLTARSKQPVAGRPARVRVASPWKRRIRLDAVSRQPTPRK